MATRRFQGSRTGVRLIPPVTSVGEEVRCRETGSTTQGCKVEGGDCWQEEVELEARDEKKERERERGRDVRRRVEGGMRAGWGQR